MSNNNLPNKMVVAVDVVVLVIGERGLEVLLVKIKTGPYAGYWALPGGVVGEEEGLDGAAKRILLDRVAKQRLHLEQLYCFGEPDRDMRGRSISVAYFAVLSEKDKINPKLAEHYAEVGWWPVGRLPLMAFDHKEIVGVTKRKLAFKLDEPEVVRRFLPGEFTLAELKRVYEVLLGRDLDKRNFIRKVMMDEEVVATGEVRSGGAHRPARLFRFK